MAMLYTSDKPNLTIKCLDEECKASKTLWLNINNFLINIKNYSNK